MHVNRISLKSVPFRCELSFLLQTWKISTLHYFHIARSGTHSLQWRIWFFIVNVEKEIWRSSFLDNFWFINLKKRWNFDRWLFHQKCMSINSTSFKNKISQTYFSKLKRLCAAWQHRLEYLQMTFHQENSTPKA